jgi:hypothetical protein
MSPYRPKPMRKLIRGILARSGGMSENRIGNTAEGTAIGAGMRWTLGTPAVRNT